MTAARASFREHWTLEPETTFLNHGSFGACPRPVLQYQTEIRTRLERQPVRFLTRELEALLDQARAALGAFVGADADDLAFVPNATAGVSTVLRALRFAPGDELLVTDHGYNACVNALRFVAERSGARVAVARVPFPLRSTDEVVAAILRSVTARTRLALIDHITSPTGLVWPIGEIISRLAALGVDTLVDGAHAPGMVDVDLNRLAAAYYTGNCHKWLCAPKGSAFLWVRRDRQGEIRPLVISHGFNSPRTDRSRFRLEFDWTGSFDPSAVLSIPIALEFLGGLLAGGWPALRARNAALACRARQRLCDTLGVPPPCPETMLGALAAVPLPGGGPLPQTAWASDPLQDALLFEHQIEVPIVPWPALPDRLVRVSAQLYNEDADYDRLAHALTQLLR